MGNGVGAQRPFSRPSSTLPRKYDSSGKRGPGRPRTAGEIEALVVRMAEENRDWGYRRIQGASSNLGHELAPSTIAEILEGHGIEPAPERSPQSRSSMSMPNDNEGAASLHDRRRAGSICRGFALYGLTVQHSCLLPQRDGRCLPVSAIHLDSGQFRISDGAP